MINGRERAVIFLLLSIVLASSSGLLIKVSAWDALPLNGGRSLIAAAMIAIYLRRPNFTWSKWQVGGAVFYALMLITFVQANKWTTAANAIFLQFTAPLWVALLGMWLLGKRPHRSDWLTMIAVGVGMFLFFGGELTTQGFWGNILAILSGICMALMLIALRRQKEGSPMETVLLGNLLAGLIGLPFILFGNQPMSVPQVGIVLFMGVIQLGLPFIFITQAIKFLQAVETVLIQVLEPVMNTTWVFLVIGEVPSPMALIGAAILVTAVTLNALISARRPREQPGRTAA